MDIRPILSALLRNRTGAVLVALQVAITLAVIANAFYIIERRLEKINHPTGVDSANLVFAQSAGFAADFDPVATQIADLNLLRALPGVVAVTPISNIPLSDGGSANTYQTKPGEELNPAAGNIFEVDDQFIATLGLRLVAGRNFRPAEYVLNPVNDTIPPQMIITEDMAKQLYGESPAVGQRIYDNRGASAEVIGVVSNMLGSWINNTKPKSTELVFTASRPLATTLNRYAVRVRPGERDRLVPEIERRLGAIGHGRLITWVRPHDFFIKRIYRSDFRLVVFLSTLVFLMTVVTALGVVGLATFHVNARRKQIGTRRALGARRRDIIRYFLVENGLLAFGGSIVGGLLAYGASGWLSRAFQQPPLPLLYVLATAIGILLLGQLAVLWPAYRAAAIDPAIATRTV